MSNLFEKPSIPKNSLQVLQWLVFEPILFKRYQENLNEIERTIMILKAITIAFSIVIIPLTLVCYIIGVIIIAGFDIPLLLDFSKLELCCYPNELVIYHKWQTYTTLWEKAYFFVSFDDYVGLKYLAGGWALGLTLGLPFALSFGLTFGLTFGLALVLLGLNKSFLGLFAGYLFSL